MLEEAISIPRLQGTGVGVQLFGGDWPKDEEAAAGWRRATWELGSLEEGRGQDERKCAQLWPGVGLDPGGTRTDMAFVLGKGL